MNNQDNLPTHHLTPQQLRIIPLIASDCSNDQIAQCLYIANKSVKNHIFLLCSKLGVRSRTGIAIRACQLGLVNLDLIKVTGRGPVTRKRPP